MPPLPILVAEEAPADRPSAALPDRDAVPGLRRKSLVEEIIGVVRRELLAGRLKPGQRLPSENELAQRFQVSRGAVREAMKTLQAVGVVEITRGNGTFIVEKPTDALLSPLVFSVLLQSGMANELVELRRLMEVGSCQLAARNATADDWERIDTAQRRYEDYGTDPARDLDVHTRLDLDFHFAILDATHNPLVIKIGRTVEELFQATIERTLEKREGLAFGVSAHRQIVDAMRGGDPEAIRRTVEASLSYWAREVEEQGNPAVGAAANGAETTR